MPDKNYRPRCGKSCLRCWENKLNHANKLKKKNKKHYKHYIGDQNVDFTQEFNEETKEVMIFPKSVVITKNDTVTGALNEKT